MPRSVVVLVNDLAQHGHIDDAIAYLRSPLPGERLPLAFVNIEQECRNDRTRRALLKLSVQEWRNRVPREEGPEQRNAGPAFAGLFSRFWNLLPREAAASISRELCDEIRRTKPEAREYPLTENPEDPKLASDQEFEFFKLMPALQELEPDLARSVLEGYPRVAAP